MQPPTLQLLTLFRNRMLEYYGTMPLAILSTAYGLSFRFSYFTCVQPVFHCLTCDFDWAIDLCLCGPVSPDVDFNQLMTPIITHELVCPGERIMAVALMHGLLGPWNLLAAAQSFLEQSFLENPPSCPLMVIEDPVLGEHVCSFPLLNWMAELFSDEDGDFLLEAVAAYFAYTVMS